jgi:serine/threonine-protein phosphatase Stp1
MVRWLPSFRSSQPPAAAAPQPSAPPAAKGGGFRIESWSVTHEGRVRTHNEDSYLARDGDGLWAVADGMGGHEGGEWASGRIVRELGRVATDKGFEASCEAAEKAILAANRQILAEGKKRGKRMGSTLVMLIVEGPRFALLWIGDSRAYLMRGGKFAQLSRDHTQVQEMVARGLMTAEQALGHPMGHVLSRAVGVQKEIEIDRVDGEVHSGDIFLLCSDGLHGVVDDEGIAAHFCREAPERALDQLVELTLANGAPDNVTGIAVWASDPTLLSFADPKP